MQYAPTSPHNFRIRELKPGVINNKSWLVESPWQSKLYYNNSVNTIAANHDYSNIASNEENLESLLNKGIASNVASPVQVLCASCGSANIKRNGKSGGKQKY